MLDSNFEFSNISGREIRKNIIFSIQLNSQMFTCMNHEYYNYSKLLYALEFL